MRTPNHRSLLLSDGKNASAFRRVQETMSDPTASRLLSHDDSSRSDASIQRLLADVTGLSPFDVADRAITHMMGGSNRSHLMGVSPSDVHIPTIDQNIFVLYQNRECIADAVMPIVNASRLSNYIEQMPVATMQQVANTRIASSRARPNQITYGVNNTLQYSCIPVGLIDYLPAELLANADSTALRTTSLYMAILKSFMDLAREYNVAAEVFGAGNYGSNTTALSGADRWDTSGSDPIDQLLTYKEQVFSTPNVLVLGGQVWPKLRTNPAVKGYIQSRASTAAGPVPLNVELSLVAELLGLERVVVGRAKYNSAQEGASTVSSYIWGKSAALIRVEPNPDPLMTETFGYTYRFGGKAYRNEVIPDRLGGAMGGQYIKLSTFEDDVVIGGANTGYLLTTVIS